MIKWNNTNLASKLCEILGCMDQHADVVRTARLAKAIW